MPRPLQIADLAVGQVINFRTRTRPWRSFKVTSLDAAHGRFTVKHAYDNTVNAETADLLLGDVIALELVA